jgi:SNF2 family DNA or RNA helicase
MEIIDNKAILLKVRNPDRFTSAISQSAYLGEVSEGVHDLLVKWTFENSVALTDMGVKKVPSSIHKDYTWTGRFTPMAHQKETAGFIVNHKKCFVFLEQGLGKTASAAWAIDYLMKKNAVKRVLIICPLSIMKAAWLRDLFSVLPHRSVGIAHGNQKTRREILTGKYEIVIINFDGIEIVEKEIKQAGFDMVVVDEANGFKSTTTRRWKSFNRIMMDIPRLVMMTGTPAAQSPEDAYGLAKLVSPHLVPTFVSGWKDLVMQKVTTFKWVPRPRANELVHKALQPAIRYTKEECLDLPDIMYATREVPLTVQQQKYYDTMRKQMLFEAAGEEVSAVNAAAKLTKLLQISSGNVYADDGSVVQLDASNRLKELEAVIDESTHKVIVFAPFTHTIDMIEAYLQKQGITCGVINGSVSAIKRSSLFDSFQDTPDPRVLIIQPQAAAHGVTLTAANTIVWFGPTSSVETYLQANARAHRKGQVNKVTVVMLQGSAVEEKMYTMLNSKINTHTALVDMYKEILNGT